ncbi:hypothetical protein P0Y35_05060, partial [Kiritimatiellaeota bacterium B1221]|nr:hypothetical protein [Kiritimatiellaeota bacterium B1221]
VNNINLRTAVIRTRMSGGVRAGGHEPPGYSIRNKKSSLTLKNIMKFILPLLIGLVTTSQLLRSAEINQAKDDPSSLKQQQILPFKLSAEGMALTMEIGDDGMLSVNKKEVGKLSGAGILFDQNSSELARLSIDGVVVMKDGNSFGKVHANGDITIDPEMKFSWDKGSLKLGEDGPMIELVPDKPETRRWASFLVVLYFTEMPQ